MACAELLAGNLSLLLHTKNAKVWRSLFRTEAGRCTHRKVGIHWSQIAIKT